jgi:hypothetical protein
MCCNVFFPAHVHVWLVVWQDRDKMSRPHVPKRMRVEAPRTATLEDVHPYTLWGMCVSLFHKFHVEVFAPGRKRLYIVLLDQKVKLKCIFNSCCCT